jgi:hypothetical protein
MIYWLGWVMLVACCRVYNGLAILLFLKAMSIRLSTLITLICLNLTKKVTKKSILPNKTYPTQVLTKPIQ